MTSESASRIVERLLEQVPLHHLQVIPTNGPVEFDVRPPGSKSVTNRALVCAALAHGTTQLTGVLYADDTVAMIECLQALGVRVNAETGSPVEIVGSGAARRPISPHLDAKLSGTTARFIAPVAALLAERAVLDGDEPLRRRPMGELVTAMRSMGAVIEGSGSGDRLPLTIDGARFRGGAVAVSGDVSSQFISALLLSGPVLADGLEIALVSDLVSTPYVEMTTRVMRDFGARVTTDGSRLQVEPSGYESPGEYLIEPDASAASYFLGAAAICGGRARIDGLGRDSLQGDIKFAEVLEQMGMAVTWSKDSVEVVHTGPLVGVEVDMADFSDVAQTLAVVASTATSPTRVTGIGFIRAKETDRIAAVVTELRRLGIDAVEEADGFVVNPGEPNPGVVQTYDDHRMAMSFALLGLRYGGITIADPRCVAKTYPGFWHDLGQIPSAS